MGEALKWPRGRLINFVLLVLFLSGCAASIERAAPPADRYFKARVGGVPNARFYGDKPLPSHAFDAATWMTQRFPALKSATPRGAPVLFHTLVLSGGGADGAFGAGVLNGWTQFGDRPEFEIVTGVSIGALMAPFAFLGPEYDEELRDMFLMLDGIDDVVEIDVFRALGGGLAFGDDTPLERLIETHVTDALLEAIAAEHAKGRRLFVVTTYLDARRPIVWNMGAIAASDAPGRLELFRQVLRASSAVPGVAEPVFIRVVLDGASYDEMHVDGGVMRSAYFAVPKIAAELQRIQDVEIKPMFWVIQNNKLRASFGPTDETLGGVLGDTVSELIRAQARGDQALLYLLAERDGFGYRLAAVPKNFDERREAMYSIPPICENFMLSARRWRARGILGAVRLRRFSVSALCRRTRF